MKSTKEEIQTIKTLLKDSRTAKYHKRLQIPLGEKRNHPGSKLRQGFWMVFRFGVNNWG
ncbi:hypothetical protein [Streptococcus pneumoniae]|uniref:hypothetical protein n=1 Tax=Streptococcus pneumoniae TaxID=1313 RepID=UPI00135B5A31|nr:hypothetical protein [Streptococcus pneumoniae]